MAIAGFSAQEAKIYKVLAVDDEMEVRKLYELFLAHQGYDIKVAADAEACLRMIKTDRPDIILMDVNMPVVNGLKLLEMVRASEDGKNIPIIMISARRDEDTIKAAGELGCDNFIIKPFELKELARRIELELMEVDINFVRQALLQQRSSNNSILHQAGLMQFNRLHWDSYPFSVDGFEYCFIVKRGLRPHALIKAKDEELKNKIKIFCKHPLRWKKIWPS